MPFLQTPTKRLHYRDVPPSSLSSSAENQKLPFVLVHGLGSSQNYYAPLIPSLAAAGHRCVALDTTGQGRSPYTFVEQSIDSLARDVADAMDALGIARAIVAGHSMAGITVPHLAATRPDRVAAAVLLGPVVPNPAAAPTFEARIAAVQLKGMEAMGDTVPYGAVGRRATGLHHAFIRELLMAQDARGYVSMCRAIVGAAAPAYGDIECPVLIVAGEDDKSAPVAGCEQIRDSIGGGRCEREVMRETGHWMCVEDAAGVGELILKWAASGAIK